MEAVDAYEEAQFKVKGTDAVIHFEEGLIGFPDCKNFILMESETLAPFRLLQCLDSPQVRFLVLEGAALINDYYDRVPVREWESIGVTGTTKPLAFIIVVIGTSPETTTGNFQAPLLINYDRMIGKQVILSDPGLSVKYPLM